jgi:integrase
MALPKGVYRRNKASPQLWITYYDENGKRFRESAHTTDPQIAASFRTVRLAQVAERRLVPTKQFDSITVSEILDFWWERHARHRNSGFEYLIPRLDKFRSMKARKLTPEIIQNFLDDLLKTLSPASVNHYRTIFNSAFNFAVKWKKYDDNPVTPIPQVPEREPRDRFVTIAELAAIVSQCREENDLELQGFVILAACTGMRRGEIMPRKWSEVRVDDEYPYIYVARTKNKRPKRLPLPSLAILALRRLPSYRTHEYLFPAKANVKYKGDFKKPHAWDLGKRFRRVCAKAGVADLRIHDLRHFATTMLFIEGVPDAIIRKMTGHRSEELERYKHLSASFKQQSVELIAGKLTHQLATKRATPSKNTNTPRKPKGVSAAARLISGGADGTRTRDLRRDRPAF